MIVSERRPSTLAVAPVADRVVLGQALVVVDADDQEVLRLAGASSPVELRCRASMRGTSEIWRCVVREATPAPSGSATTMQATLKVMRSRWGQVRRTLDVAEATSAADHGPWHDATDAAGGPAPRQQTGRPRLAADDQALDLAGALADLEDLGVAVVAGDRRLVHEPVAAEDLGGLAGGGDGRLGGVELGHGRLLLERAAQRPCSHAAW